MKYNNELTDAEILSLEGVARVILGNMEIPTGCPAAIMALDILDRVKLLRRQSRAASIIESGIQELESA